MSWSSSYPPPPRRSRSRSPSRGSYPPRPAYPDPHYPQEPYYDTYDRDKWAYFERERPGYEYGRRGRSRSPPPDDYSRKRRRSPSPYERDRYEPRPRYNDDYDAPSRGGYGYTSPPRRTLAGSYPPSRRPPMDPHHLDYPASLKQYAEWFRYYYPQQAIDEDNADKAAEQEAGDGSKPRNGIKSRWENYKKDFAASQLATMFDHHKKSPWFAEKYDPSPEFQSLRTRVRKEGWKGRIDTFLLDLESGKFDLDPRDHEAAQSTSTSESLATQNGDHNPLAANGADEGKGTEDDMQFAMYGDDDTGEQDTNKTETNGKSHSQDPRKATPRAEEISMMPEGNQVTIRTIPPDIGRVKLEDSLSKMQGFKYLALGDPMQKRNYYRAGWIRFQDDADMSGVMSELAEKKIEGFKLHVTHNTRPFTAKVRCTPDIASRSERLEKDLSNIKTLAALLEEEAAKLRTMRVKKVTTSKAPDASVPDSDAQMEDASDECLEEDPEPKEKGSDAVERRVEKIMFELREQGAVDINDEKAYEEKKVSVSLDMYCAYLRAAYHTCYYCALVADHIEELQRKCIKHERKPFGKATFDESKDTGKDIKSTEELADTEKDSGKEKRNENARNVKSDERWLEWLDSKVALLINRDGVDPHDYGGKRYQEELTKVLESHIKQEDEGKFRCKTCQKLFKATSFVEKHIANKHPELVTSLEDIPYFNNFALDPHRIQPFVHPPQQTGGGQQPPPQAYGIQAPVYTPAEYSRPGVGQYNLQMPYPPMYHNGGYWDHNGVPPATYQPMPQPMRRDEATTARRLSDRITGFAPPETSTLPPAIGLPPKPSAAALDSALQAGNGGPRRGGRSNSQTTGPPPPPPPDAKEDPRAAAGKRVSYHDMDLVAEGDVELTY